MEGQGKIVAQVGLDEKLLTNSQLWKLRNLVVTDWRLGFVTTALVQVYEQYKIPPRGLFFGPTMSESVPKCDQG